MDRDAPRVPVLLVEDEPDIAESIRELLVRMRPSVEVTAALSGRAAVAQLAERPWRLLLVDYHLPDLDGLAVLREARAVVPSATRVLVTAHGDPRLGERAREEAAVHAVLRKPFRREELAGLLDALPGEGVRRAG